jgi:type IV pilus biogenesis protein CpaD/CtpE
MAILNTSDEDLLVIEMQSRPFAGSARLASRLLTAAVQSERPILLLRSGAGATHDIICLIQGTGESAARLVVFATRLASAGKRSLTLFLASNAINERTALELVRSVSPELAERCRIERPNRHTLANTAAAGRLMIVDADPTINDAAALRNLLATTQADILFLR